MDLFDAIKAYPDIALPIIIKSDMLRCGIKYSNGALEEVERRGDIRLKSYALFSYDFSGTTVASQNVPYHIFIADSTDDGTMVQSRVSEETPYLIDYTDGRFVVYHNQEMLVDVHHFGKRARFADRVTEDGTSYEAYVHTVGDDCLFITANKFCEYFSRDKQCLFCDLTPHASTQKKGGEAMILRVQAERTAEVLDVALHETGYRHMIITGGTFLGKYQGKTEIEYYTEFLNTLRANIYLWPMVGFQIGALDNEGWRRIHETGVPSVQPNIEVWDEKLFKILCPGKSERIGYQEWIKRTINAVKYWGRGNVNPSFVPGVEMAKPQGFEKVSDAIKSTSAGYNFLMSNDVLPRQGGFWCVEPDSKLAGQSPPSLEYYLEIGMAYLEAREKHGFPNPCPACCRHCLGQGTEYDFAYFHGSTPASLAAEQNSRPKD